MRVQRIVTPTQRVVKGAHVGLDPLRIGEHIVALLRIDSREPIEQGALEPQGDGRARLQDGLACFLDIDFLDSLP